MAGGGRLRPLAASGDIDISTTGEAADPGSALTRLQAFRLGRRFPRRDRGLWFGVAIDALWPLLVLGTRLRVVGGQHLPSSGPVLVAANHLSFADPVTMTLFCLAGGRVPRYLAKAELWETPVVRAIMRSGRHIPVHRGRAAVRDAYVGAVTALKDGECVVIFPEGGFSTRDDGWPSKGKPGVGKIALDTGVPVVPVVNWGTHEVLPPDRRLPRLYPRRTVHLVAGPPVDLADLAGEKPSATDAARATRRIMDAITDLQAGVRGERPPA